MKAKILVFDIETAPLLAHVWSPYADYVPNGQMIHDTFMLSYAAKWYGDPDIWSSSLTGKEARRQDDKRIVLQLADLIRKADIVIAHNVDKFDIPKVNQRLLMLGLEPLGPVRTLDTLRLAKQNFALAYNKLDWLAQSLGLGNKIKTDFDLWKEAYHGDESALFEMLQYNEHDVVLLEQVFDKMKPYVKNLPRLFTADYARQMACPFCGSDKLVKRGEYDTQANTFQKYRCSDCRKYSRADKSDSKKRLGVRPL